MDCPGQKILSGFGSSARSMRIKRFEDAIARGQILLMVDVTPGQLEEVENMLQRNHPEASFEGMDPAIPAFP